MVVINKVYTRSGDQGQTHLGDGSRVGKDDLRVCAYGEVDEVNATLGLAKLHCQSEGVRTMLASIQNDLFDLGADLCVPMTQAELDAQKSRSDDQQGQGSESLESAGSQTGVQESAQTYKPLRIQPEQVTRLEKEIDRLNERLQPLTSFILPGGSKASTYLHLARTITRRAERSLTKMLHQGTNEHAYQYLNRLSDFLFVAGRYENDFGHSDVLWSPGRNQKEG